MPFFERTPILLDGETVAEQLRRARQATGLKVEEAARRLKIRRLYLDALEKGDYHLLPQGVYRLNFLREYAYFLGLDPLPLIKQFNREVRYAPVVKGQLFDRRVVSKRHLLALPQLVRNAIIGVLIIGCLVYVGVLLQRIFKPPFLEVTYPTDSLVVTETKLIISGQSEPEAEIKINGETVLADNQGYFEREIYLQAGINNITISSEKKYSRPAIVTRQVLVKN